MPSKLVRSSKSAELGRDPWLRRMCESASRSQPRSSNAKAPCGTDLPGFTVAIECRELLPPTDAWWTVDLYLPGMVIFEPMQRGRPPPLSLLLDRIFLGITYNKLCFGPSDNGCDKEVLDCFMTASFQFKTAFPMPTGQWKSQMGTATTGSVSRVILRDL